MTKKVYFLPNICAGCEECLESCAREHEGITLGYLETIGLFSIPIRCFHCVDAPCSQICPTKAISTHEEGAVVSNPNKCIGCGSCLLVCPFGIPKLDIEKKVMRKCDLCIHRLKEGQSPACVQNCSLKALKFGNIEDYEKDKRQKAAGKLLKHNQAVL